MNDNFLKSILNESDLEAYEKFISLPEFNNTKIENFSSLLNNAIGKSIKIYIAGGNQLFARQGKLSGVFDDFLILTQNREKIAVKFCEIKFISML